MRHEHLTDDRSPFPDGTRQRAASHGRSIEQPIDPRARLCRDLTDFRPEGGYPLRAAACDHGVHALPQVSSEEFSGGPEMLDRPPQLLDRATACGACHDDPPLPVPLPRLSVPTKPGESLSGPVTPRASITFTRYFPESRGGDGRTEDDVVSRADRDVGALGPPPVHSAIAARPHGDRLTQGGGLRGTSGSPQSFVS